MILHDKIVANIHTRIKIEFGIFQNLNVGVMWTKLFWDGDDMVKKIRKNTQGSRFDEIGFE